MPEKLNKKEILEKIENPVILPRTLCTSFNQGLAKLYRESLDAEFSVIESVSVQNFINIEASTDSSQIMASEETITTDFPDATGEEVETVKKTALQRRELFANDLKKLQAKGSESEEVGSTQIPLLKTSSLKLQLRSAKRFKSENCISGIPIVDAIGLGTIFPATQEIDGTVYNHHCDVSAQYKMRDSMEDESQEKILDSSDQKIKQSTPIKERNHLLRRSTLQLYLETPYRREMSKSTDFALSGFLVSDVNTPRYQEKSAPQKANVEVTYEDVAIERSQFSSPEKIKRLSQSVPALLDETDGRDTDSASENSFQLGRHKKTPSSLTNLSGSSGMASLSSVSGSVMSVYSGDFGNVDIKGNIQFAIDYVDDLQEFHIFVAQCKDLAVADVKKQRSDPYVKTYLLPEKAKMGKRKTPVKKKTLNPVYNDVLRYKISKQSLQSQTLNLSVWHNDVLGRNSFLGEVEMNLASWDWNNKQMNWYSLQPRTPAAGIGLERRGEIKLALKYIPEAFAGAKNAGTGEVHIWIKDCSNLPILRGNKINSFVKCTILPDTSRKSRQKTRTVDKTPNPYFNHTMVYDGFREDDLKEACVELTVWDHNKLTNHFLGGLRIGLGTGKSYGTAVDWMDSNAAEATTWERMISTPNTWIEAELPLRMLKMAKMAK
ncbi:hypothetical protein GDO86_004763 [Hymenochirus boettgeri]|uniref:Synaptotagmin-like protein 2 n=1 Tax=Hymenochirus boettgeri TaxID=247094 RepID=A0A8T2KA00_9PIPI|nr:hypothetical protein GDO86_004763 [Hymenochirus boettgeri]